jgi:hypothetical protein
LAREVCSYVETEQRGFVREVSLPGANLSTSPALIPRASLHENAHVTRVPKHESEHLGFSTTDDLVMTKFEHQAGSWLVVIRGAIGDDLTLLRLYVALLDQSMNRAIDAATARVVVAVAKGLLRDDHEPDAQAGDAVAEIEQTLRMSSVALTVTTASGVPLVRVGSPPAGGDPNAGQLVVVTPLTPQATMALAVGWPAGHQVTPLERRVVNASADLLAPWARRVAREFKNAGERRADPRSFEQILDRMARQVVERGGPVTVIVFSFGQAVVRPGVTQTRIGPIREQVRGTDLVGRLGEGEIGMLLCDTAGNQAKLAVTRLRRILETTDEAWSRSVSVGFASRDPGSRTWMRWCGGAENRSIMAMRLTQVRCIESHDTR